MPTVRNTSNRSYISESVGRVDPGEAVDVSEDKATYLLEETDYFEAATVTDVEFSEVEEAGDDGEGDGEDESVDLEDLLKEDLLERAREEDIEGRSDMTKAELIVALSDEPAESDEGED